MPWSFSSSPCLAAIPAAYLLGVLFWRNRDQWRSLLGATAIAAGVGAVVLGVGWASERDVASVQGRDGCRCRMRRVVWHCRRSES